MELTACLDDITNRVDTVAVTGHARELPLLRPATIAIHDDGDMLRECSAAAELLLDQFILLGLFGIPSHCLASGFGSEKKDNESTCLSRDNQNICRNNPVKYGRGAMPVQGKIESTENVTDCLRQACHPSDG
jgi:hypothetical protein